MDVRSRYMSFDHITTDFCGMAGANAVGHAELFAFRGNIAYIMGLHLEAILAKVFDPSDTTTTSGTFENLDARRALGENRRRRKNGENQGDANRFHGKLSSDVY